jgi:hypothetical protein
MKVGVEVSTDGKRDAVARTVGPEVASDGKPPDVVTKSTVKGATGLPL